jgi:hypothetical protein
VPQRRSLRRRARSSNGRPVEAEAPRLILDASPSPRDSALDPILRALQILTVCYPRVIAGFVNAMVSEGKRFAETREGARLRRELCSTDWVEKGRILWETCGLDELLNEEAPASLSDESVAEAIRSLRRNLAQADLEPLLSRLIFRGISQNHDDLSRADSGVRQPQ